MRKMPKNTPTLEKIPDVADVEAGRVLTADGEGGASWEENAPGTGVTSVTAGTGLNGGTITSSGTISVDDSVIATREWVEDGLSEKQDALTAGTGISLSGATIGVDTDTIVSVADLETRVLAIFGNGDTEAY